MPNWVNNWVNILGTEQELTKFYELIDKKPFYVGIDQEAWDSDKDRFSFHSFLTLPNEDRYEEYHETNGSKPDGNGGHIKTGNTEFNWYNWNTKHWDTKWDASSPSVIRSNVSCTVQFETAWSPPIPVFNAMCEAFPELHFDFEYEEEQGWGGKGESVNGEYVGTMEWDIPQCHADYVNIDREGSCICQSGSYPPEELYTDCPDYRSGETNRFKVSVITNYYIEAWDADEAEQTVKAYESGYEMPENTQVVSVEYNAQYVVNEQEKENV